MYCGRNSEPLIIMNNIICHNLTVEYGGGIYLSVSSNTTIVNNTMIQNFAYYSGDGIYCGYSNPAIVNNIIRPDSVDSSYSPIGGYSHHPLVSYSNIFDGFSGEGNIDIDPLFRDPDNGDYHLMSTACGDSTDSPCIDTGDPSIFDYLLDCDWGLGGRRSDMGAYGGRAVPTEVIDESEPDVPMVCGLLQNYPNPFNATTTLSYMLPQTGPVIISVYNLLGQRVRTIFEGKQQAGSHSLIWDASDLPSGVYFARLEAGERSQSVKMVLLK
jgi:parallel beta-helix repeat protein